MSLTVNTNIASMKSRTNLARTSRSLQGSCLASSRTVGPACCSGSDPPLASAPPGCLLTCYDLVTCKIIPITVASKAISKPPISQRFSCWCVTRLLGSSDPRSPRYGPDACTCACP